MSIWKFFKIGFTLVNVVLSAEAEVTAVIKEYRTAMADHHLSADEALGILDKLLAIVYKIYPSLKP